MKKSIVLLLAMIMVASAFTLVACGNKKSGGSSAGEGDKIVVKIGHTDSGERSTNKAGLWLNDYLSEKSDGRITVEMYPDGQAGDDPDLCAGVKLGTVTMYFGLSSVLSAATNEKVSCVDLPYLYDNYDAWVEGTFENGGLDLMNKYLEGSGYTVLDMLYNGMRCIDSNSKIYHMPADFKGQKVRIAQNDLNVAIWDSIGASPTPTAWGEVVTSLSQGTVHALDHSLGVFNDFKLYEMAPYITITNHCSSPYPLVCSTEWLDSLSEDDRVLILDGIKQMCEKQRKEERENELAYIKTFQDAGAEVYELTPEETEAFKKATKPVYDEWADRVGQDVLDSWLETVPEN